MTMKSFLRISTLAALTLQLAASAQQAPQTPPAQQSQANSATTKTAPAKPAPAKKAVVWNDDNIGSIRSSADNYQMAQAQQEEAQKAAAAKQGATNQPAANSSGKTAEQLDSMIASKSHELAGEQDYLKNLQKQVNDPTVTGTDRQRLEWRLKSHSVTEQTLQSDIKQLQADKDALAKKQGASSSSSQPQSQ